MRTTRIMIYFAVLAAMLGLVVFAAQRPLHAQAEEPPGETIPPVLPLFLPLVSREEAPTVEPTPTAEPTPTQPPRTYTAIPVEPPPSDRPADVHPDLNLSIRGFVTTTGHLGLVNYGGRTDPLAPQIDGMFVPPRLPAFRTLYQVHDWDWGCNAPDGCRGAPITDYLVTLLEMETVPTEVISIPRRSPSIYSGDFKALVLYAEERRLTITYTRGDTAADGYLIHLEDLAVNPGLIALYQQLNADGRGQLPALRNGEIIGVADRGTVTIATRDTGQFLDPRACKDWWSGYMEQCTVQLRRPR
ncbi:MAG: hypothetical protein R6W76_06865 [Caldilinea sp.]